ncbi:MAG: hypothetical protein ABWK01_07135 [Infirmifilum sp.]
MTFDKAVLVLGSPSFTFESGASTLTRVLESFDVKSVEIFYSRFAELEAKRLQYFASKLFNLEVNISPLPNLLSQAVEALEKVTTRDSLVVPTAGSLLGAIASTHVADKIGARILHVMFPFGPWSGFFYPYIPRYLQPIVALGGAVETSYRPFDAKKAESFLGDTENIYITTKLGRAIARISLMLNTSLRDLWVNDVSTPELTLELRDDISEKELSINVYARTTTHAQLLCNLAKVERHQAVKSIPTLNTTGSHARASIGTGSASLDAFHRFVSEVFYLLAGGREKCLGRKTVEGEGFLKGILNEMYTLTGFELLSLDPKSRYVIDTNVVYKGIHNVARPGGPRIIIPYCVRYEVLDKLARSKSPCSKFYMQFVRLALEMLESYASRIPSNPVNCDMAIPAIDPELIRKAVILSADSHAVDMWKEMVLSKYTLITPVTRNMIRPASGAELHYALIQLAAFLCLLRKHIHP